MNYYNCFVICREELLSHDGKPRIMNNWMFLRKKISSNTVAQFTFSLSHKPFDCSHISIFFTRFLNTEH